MAAASFQNRLMLSRSLLDFYPLWRGRKGALGSHGPTCLLVWQVSSPKASQEVCTPTASDLGEERVSQANVASHRVVLVLTVK